MNRFQLEINDGPVDWHRIANSGQMFRLSCDGTTTTFHDGNHTSLLNGVEVETTLTELEFRHFLRLERSHQSILDEIIRRGPEIEPYLFQMDGLRMLRPTSKVEVLFSFLCSANNHVKRISKMVWSLASFSEHGFPTADEISKVSEQQLRSMGFGYRAASIPKVAGIIASNGGNNYLDDLSASGYEVARKELLAMPSIGPKLADCICLFAFDHAFSVPIDTHIWQQLTHLYHPEWRETALTHSKYEEAANRFRDRFGELAGIAHQFLFVENMTNWRAKKT